MWERFVGTAGSALQSARGLDVGSALNNATNYIGTLIPNTAPATKSQPPAGQPKAVEQKSGETLNRYTYLNQEVIRSIASFSEVFMKIFNDNNWNGHEAIEFLAHALGQLTMLRQQVQMALQPIPVAEASAEANAGREELIRNQAALDMCINECEMSLLERKMFRNVLPEKIQLQAQISNNPNENVKTSFAHAYLTFLDPQFASQVTLPSMLFVLTAHGQDGKFHSAGKALCKLISDELFKRIEAETLSERNQDFVEINTMLARLASDTHRNLNRQIKESIDLKADAFRHTYKAMHAAQTTFFGLFKSNFLRGKENMSNQDLVDSVRQHAQADPKCRSARAWRFVQQHYRDVNDVNLQLVKKCYRDGILHSWLFLSKVSGESIITKSTCEDMIDTLTPEQVAAGKLKPNSRMQDVCRELGPRRV